MAQHDYNLANAAGASFRADLNNALTAIVSWNSGASAPSPTFAYQRWVDTTAGVLKRRNAANSAWLVEGTLGETRAVSRSSNTILGMDDFGKSFFVTGTFTQTFTAAATLADGWWVGYRNDGSGTITLDPNASETIDGATTLSLLPGEACIIVCTGSAFKTYGRVANSAVTTAKLADSAVTTVKIADSNVTAVKLATDSVITAKVQDSAITTAKLNDGAVTQTKIGSAIIGQGQLKVGTNQGTVGTSGTAVLAGGRFCFLPTAYLGGGSGADGIQVAPISVNRQGASPTPFFGIDNWHFSGEYRGTEVTGVTYEVLGDDQRTWTVNYVTASPPYDLGDGEIPHFIFAHVDSGGNVLNVWTAEDPPWAHNGPTDIRPDVYGTGGKAYKRVRSISPADRAALLIPERRDAALARIAASQTQLVEITQEMKNRDMAIIPQPFMRLPLGHSVVMLPVSPMLEVMADLLRVGEPVGHLLIQGYIRLDNLPMNRAGPPGVLQVAPRWRNT